MVKKYLLKNMKNNEIQEIIHAWDWVINGIYLLDMLDGRGEIPYKVLSSEQIKL
jgi:hypothetical protein